MKPAFIHVTSVVALVTCLSFADAPAFAANSSLQSAATPHAAEAEDMRLLEFLDAAYDESTALSPETLAALGSKQHHDRFGDYTDAGAERAQALAEAQLARMRREFDSAKLGPQARLSYALFEHDVLAGRRRLDWRSHTYAIPSKYSIIETIPMLLINQHRIDNAADAEAYVARIRDAGRALNEVGARARAQAEAGVVPPKFVFAPLRTQIAQIIKGAPFDDGSDSMVLADFRKKVDALAVPPQQKASLIEDAAAALAGPFKQGYAQIGQTLDALERTSKGDNGLWSLPDGERFYQASLDLQTTTSIGADEVHRIGLAQVAEIRPQLEALKRQLGYAGTLKEVYASLKADPRYGPADDETYLKEASRQIDQVLVAVPRWFRKLPKSGLEVRPVEKLREPTASIASYEPPAADGSRPAIYYINLATLRQVLRTQLEGMSYHEAVPGHHFQIALAQEMENIPKFRRFGFYGAYVEGWGVYGENLGREMGFFQDPVSEFNRLATRLWRAARLVADTGINSKRWSRTQTMDYLRQNTLVSEEDIAKEVERYLDWPGQVVTYGVGALKIETLRSRAQNALGDRFDIRDFHDAVLESGALPLEVLEQQVDAYIARKKA